VFWNIDHRGRLYLRADLHSTPFLEIKGNIGGALKVYTAFLTSQSPRFPSAVPAQQNFNNYYCPTFLTWYIQIRLKIGVKKISRIRTTIPIDKEIGVVAPKKRKKRITSCKMFKITATLCTITFSPISF
jgi:hypothetical protein